MNAPFFWRHIASGVSTIDGEHRTSLWSHRIERPSIRADPAAARRRCQGLVPFLAEPNVSVIVVAARSVQVTIHGAIAHPGIYQLGRPTTVMELIAQAGGLSEFARADQISIVRQEGGASTYHTFDYNRFKQGFSAQNLVFKAGDIVIVP